MSGVFDAVGKVFNAVLSIFIPMPSGTHQKLGDIARQTAKEGEPRPIVWGRVRPIGGNIIHSSEPKIVRVKQDSGGKGGGGSKSTTEEVYRTYAIRVCEGPITAFVRIWRNNKLVYDARGLTIWGIKNNPQFLKKGSLFLGDWDQMPSAVLEAIWGVGEVPAYRGTAYIVVDNENVTDLGGAVPQYVFEVERAEGAPLTSRPYPIELMDAMGVNGAAQNSRLINYYQVEPPVEGMEVSGSVTGGTLRDQLQQYSAEVEAIDVSGAVTGGALKNVYNTYTAPAEAIEVSGTITGGTLDAVLITYTIQAEALDVSGAVTGGTLT